MERKLLSISAARFSDSFGGGMAYFVLPILISSLSISELPVDTASGIVISLWGMFATLSQPFAGKIIERSGKPKKYLTGSLVLTSLLIFLYSRVETMPELVLLRAFLGIVESFMLVSSLTVVLYISGRKRGEGFGVYNTFTDLGFSVSPTVAGFLILYGINLVFYFSAILVLASSLGILLFVDDIEIRERSKKSSSWRNLSREVIPVFISLSFAVAMMSSIVPLENSFLTRLKITPLEFGISFTLYLLVRTLSNTPAGILTDRLGSWRVYWISSALLSITGLFFMMESFSTFLAVRLIQGFIVPMVYTSSAVHIAQKSNIGYAISMGLLSSSITAGLTAGPLIAGLLSGYIGFDYVYIFFSLMISLPVIAKSILKF